MTAQERRCPADGQLMVPRACRDYLLGSRYIFWLCPACQRQTDMQEAGVDREGRLVLAK